MGRCGLVLHSICFGLRTCVLLGDLVRDAISRLLDMPTDTDANVRCYDDAPCYVSIEGSALFAQPAEIARETSSRMLPGLCRRELTKHAGNSTRPAARNGFQLGLYSSPRRRKVLPA